MQNETYLYTSSGETFVRNLTAPRKKEFVVKAGSRGAVLNFQLFDENRQPVSLNNFTVIVKAQKGSIVLFEIEADIAANQNFAGRGLASAKLPFIELGASGTYRLEVTITNGTDVLKFPNNGRFPFAELIVTKTL